MGVIEAQVEFRQRTEYSIENFRRKFGQVENTQPHTIDIRRYNKRR